MVNIKPNTTKLAEEVFKATNITLSDDTTFEFKNTSLTFWINKDSFVIEKYNSFVSMDTSKTEEDEIGEKTTNRISLDYEVSYRIQNVNQQLSISLSPEAEKAVDVTKRFETIYSESDDI